MNNKISVKILTVKKNFFLIFPILYGCTQDISSSNFDIYKKINSSDYKICLSDANHSIDKLYNINQDRIVVLQTDDTMVDFYNIENDIDNIKLSAKRNKMIDECMKNRMKK